MGGKREIFCKKLDKCIIRSIKIHNCTHPWKIFSHADQNILFHLFLNLWNVFSFLILISSTWPGLINLEASLNKENAQVTVWKKKLFSGKDYNLEHQRDMLHCNQCEWSNHYILFKCGFNSLQNRFVSFSKYPLLSVASYDQLKVLTWMLLLEILVISYVCKCQRKR